MNNTTVVDSSQGHCGRILVVDDDKPIRWSLKLRLEDEGHSVVEAINAAEALDRFSKDVEVVLLDFVLPDKNGLEVMAQMRSVDADVPVIMITGRSSVTHAVHAMKAGAFHYAGKPFELEEVVLTVDRALETTRLRRQVRDLKAHRSHPSIDAIIGQSPAMCSVKSLVRRVARSPASTVIITGESGTGKDLVARAVHALSARSEHPFLNITCSALPAALLESELFGHEQGAFTDAKIRKRGLLEHADGGTVFLDEIGEMELPLQAKLLRFLEAKTFRRVGGTNDITTDVRVISATNVDLREAVRNGSFREDLYYRLAVLTIHISPLRERDGDIDLLTAYLIDRFNIEFGRRVVNVDPAAMNLLRRHPWPGNVRELRNAIERAVLMSESHTLVESDFAFLSSTTVDDKVMRLPAGGIDISSLVRSLLVQALERTEWNQTRAAALLGMNRDQVRYRIERLGLSKHREPSCAFGR